VSLVSRSLQAQGEKILQCKLFREQHYLS